MKKIEQLEYQLDSFDAAVRSEALKKLWEKAQNGEVQLPPVSNFVNLHCHTFFSYNTYGYSPSKFAWLAKKSGLAAAGVVDFDVLDGADEFLAAAKMLGLKACAGMESRVFVPEFATRVINSPGEPGIAYHMGVGFPKGTLIPSLKKFQMKLFNTAQQRNRDLIGLVNAYLSPVELNYEKDVLPLTPAGNATERHICLAYARKAQQHFDDAAALSHFWTQKLGTNAAELQLPEGAKILNEIRTKTMKRGGIGYVQPDGGLFPTMADMNKFILEAGGIPTLTWLDGTSEGEKAIEELADVAISTGAAALNIIPDRNYTPGVKDEKLANLYAVVELAERRGLLIIVGTEMNSPGNKFVDSFDAAELKPFVPIFLKGANAVYTHSQRS
ncbi:MAG: PHP domain-containing protein [Phycisphaerae bacterium]|jgi:hypothetical protein